jgi:Carboxypeptidase regulatory-like domain
MWLLALALSVETPRTWAQIAGQVVRADNGAPIESATIQLEIALGDQQARYFGDFSETVKTDRNGQYTLQGLPPGVYVIAVSAPGFIAEAYPHDSDTDYLTSTHPGTPALVLKDGMEFRNVDFKLMRESVISGVVVDANGAPVGAGLPVVAIRRGKRQDGSVNYWGTGSDAKTDAEGRFAVRQLPPDTYTLCVNCRLTTVVDWGVCWFGDIGEADEYPATWYGDTRTMEDALQVPLKDGEVRDSIRIVVQRVKRYNIVVWPHGPENPVAPNHYDVYLRDWWDEGKLQADGSYLIPNVPPGHYTVVVRPWPGGRQGERSIDVKDVDVKLHVDASAN